jgi:hypothetical protein
MLCGSLSNFKRAYREASGTQLKYTKEERPFVAGKIDPSRSHSYFGVVGATTFFLITRLYLSGKFSFVVTITALPVLTVY